MARPLTRQRENEEESASTGPGVVMVGGMDDLIDDQNREIETDDKDKTRVVSRETPKTGDEDRSDSDRQGRRRDIDEDSRLAYDEGNDDELEERTSRRARRNRSRREALSGRDMAIQGLQQKVDQLTHMLSSMGQSQVGLTINSVETQLSAAQQALMLADAEMEKAVTESNGARFREVQQLRDEAAARVFQLNNARGQLKRDAQAGRVPGMSGGGQVRQPQPQAGTGLSARAQEFTETFMSRFTYFDPNSTDEDTLVMKGVDDAVAAEGYRPDTPLYWRELEKRLAARGFLPDHMQDDERGEDREDRGNRRESRQEDAPQRRTNGGRPPSSSPRGGGRGTQSTFRLHPMMVGHLRDEGLDDVSQLDDEQKAKRSRLIAGWRENERRAARGEFNKS